MSKLLIHEAPVMIIPSLAVRIGLIEAVILQQIHYWMMVSVHEMEGRKWVYNTYQNWKEQLPFWSESTIKRAIKSLEAQGLVVTANFNRSKMDKTKWYSICYEKLARFEEGGSVREEEAGEGTVETQKEEIPFAGIIDYLNERTGSAYRPESKKTKSLIAARWREGFREADFRRVIDSKAAEWLGVPRWSKFLRPETLFGTKFESYLNQKVRLQNLAEEDYDLDD
ncbi:conserved phage C-terminal domain-containing protein [Peribacillus sp. SCS-26]|uniref:conserved phage C-terminal domain-containing protein n=1 Tax=Paraperibacillus marinus TaxID=3115295 RepID=UPI0039062635